MTTQSPPSTQPPPPGPFKNVSFPEIPGTQISNGMRVAVVEDGYLPKTSVRLGIWGGRLVNPASNLALAELTAELLSDGTETKNALEISEIMDSLAIHYDGMVFMEHSVFAISALSEHLEKGLELFSDLILHPSFPESEVAKAKTRWHSSLIAQRSDPGFLANERTYHQLYKNHPYSNVSVPIQHLEQSEAKDLAEIHRSAFSPQRSILMFSGPIDLERSVELASRFFGGWKSGTGHSGSVEKPNQVQERRLVQLVHRPHSVQSRLVISGFGLSSTDPDQLPLRLGNQVLGGGGSARLFLNLREDKGYTYGSYSSIRGYQNSGLFLATADVASQVTVPAIGEILHEISRMRQAPAEDFELSRAKAELIGNFIRQMETPARIGAMELSRRLLDLPEDHYRTLIPRLQALDAQSVWEVTREVFDEERALITVVGDREVLEAGLAEFGEVQVFDVEGNRI